MSFADGESKGVIGIDPEDQAAPGREPCVN